MTLAPRAWQAAFLARHAARADRDFLLVATPGAGKTLAACQAARAAGCEHLVVVCPTTALRSQWADAADRVGLHLDPRCGPRSATRNDDSRYRERRFAPMRELSRSCATTRTVVAPRTSSMATAKRSRMPSAARSRSGCWTQRCAGESARKETIAAFADELDPQDDARRLRTAIDPATPLLPQMLRDADALLVKARSVIADGAGLVLCDDRAHARATAALLRTISGQKPVLVVSDEAGAHARIERFARGDAGAPRWIVAVNMVSEGVDVPRLVLATYATVKRTDLFFRQAVGRIVRRRAQDPDDLVATVFLPGDPTLKGCAERVEVELRQQVSDEVGQGFDVEPPIGTGQRADFQALDAEVAPGGVIVAGVHYRREEVDAARRLLRELGQPERALRSVLEFVRREHVGRQGAGGAGPPAAAANVPAHRRVDEKRLTLDRLARRWAQLRREIDGEYTWPQAQARVNRAMGVARRKDACESELDQGLAFLRMEVAKLAAAYPDKAERLRIPSSIEAIDERLSAALREC